MQAVEYILDDQTINSEQVWGSIITNCHSLKKGSVVNEQHYFGYWTLSDTNAGS